VNASAALAIEVEGLSKRYRGHRPRLAWLSRFGPGDEPRRRDDAVADLDDDVVGSLDDDDEGETAPPVGDQLVWALRDLSFGVAAGTTLGVIGANGSGKSTLLRVLTRLTPPTTGTVILRGRVAPLVPSLPGLMQRRNSLERNVAQVARFYGIPVDEALSRVDAVVEFAELEEHADEPAAALSRGEMQRFAFATAVKLNPDILIADETIVVGDHHFQQRCREELGRQAQQGLTVVFATHQLDLIEELCDEALLLDAGRIVERGATAEIIRQYTQGGYRTKAQAAGRIGDEPESGAADVGNGPVRSARMYSTTGRPITDLHHSEEAVVEIVLELPEAPATVRCTLALRGPAGIRRAAQPAPFTATEPGRYLVSAYLPAGTLESGTYSGGVVALGFTSEGRHQLGALRDAFSVDVFGGTTRASASADAPAWPEKRQLALSWSVARSDLVP